LILVTSRCIVGVALAGVTEVEPRTSDVEQLPSLLPEVQPRSVNSSSADTNAEDTLYLNDDMEIEDDWMDIGSAEDLVGSDLFGFRNLRPEVAAGHTSASAQSAQQTTSSGNNSVR